MMISRPFARSGCLFSFAAMSVGAIFSLAPVCAAQPVQIILDTDMQTDCDDVGALAVLHALADRGEAQILGTIVCVLNPWATPCTDAVNTFYGRPDLPLAALKGTDGVNLPSKFAEGIAKSFPHDADAASVPDATLLYRQLLTKAAEQSVTILSVGYMTNLALLLNSPADDVSPLTGRELIRRKVKTWICMGGNFPDDELKTGSSDNVNFRRHPNSAIECISDWPGPIVFVGREIGHSMRAGERLNEAPTTNPVRRAYELYFGGAPKDRHCADLAAVLYAVRGLGEYWDLHSTGSVSFTTEDARFRWLASPDKEQAYLLRKMDPDAIDELLEDLMIQPPVVRK
jgi:hypothetical protein